MPLRGMKLAVVKFRSLTAIFVVVGAVAVCNMMMGSDFVARQHARKDVQAQHEPKVMMKNSRCPGQLLPVFVGAHRKLEDRDRRACHGFTRFTVRTDCSMQ